MAQPLLLPFGIIQPDQILRQYADWVYFTLVLILFIAIAGVTLRKHFDQPYVKPLIVSVGLILAVGTFMAKRWLVTLFEAWGILGLILLGFIALFIPFALARGFGMPGLRAFYMTYALAYIVSWVKFPQLYYTIADANLGLINLGLLILFFWAIYKAIWFHPSEKSLLSRVLHQDGPGQSKTEKSEKAPELRKQEAEVRGEATTVNQREVRTVEEMATLIRDIQQTLAQHQNNLPKAERERVSRDLKLAIKNKGALKREIDGLRQQAQRLGRSDVDKVRTLQERANGAAGQEKERLVAELRVEEEKLGLERAVLELDSRLDGQTKAFAGRLDMAMSRLGSNSPIQAQQYLVRAQQTLQEMVSALTEVKGLEEKLLKVLEQQERAT